MAINNKHDQLSPWQYQPQQQQDIFCESPLPLSGEGYKNFKTIAYQGSILGEGDTWDKDDGVAVQQEKQEGNWTWMWEAKVLKQT